MSVLGDGVLTTQPVLSSLDAHYALQLQLPCLLHQIAGWTIDFEFILLVSTSFTGLMSFFQTDTYLIWAVQDPLVHLNSEHFTGDLETWPLF